MGTTKTEGFDKDILSVAEILKVLGHPARLSILKYLANRKECITNDIVDALPLAQPTISRHLSEMKRVGLIQGAISGKNICYCINEDVIQENIHLLSELIKNDSINKCC